MSDDHKAALARGRNEGRVVREYLDSQRANKPKRGRRRTVDSINQRLAAIDEHLATADALTELRLRQEQKDLQVELTVKSTVADHTATEDAFVEVAKAYSERQGISYSTWRDVGVDAAVLKRAGVAR